MTVRPIPVISAIRTLRERYGAWLCDVWGVVHNGVRPFPGAVDALVRFREDGGLVLLLTNSPRPASSVLAQLDRIGVDRAAFDAVVTSGDATRDWLAGLGGQPVMHIGPPRDRALFADLSLNLVGAEEASVILCTGLIDDDQAIPDSYTPLLASFAARGATMMCANPDLVVEVDGTLFACAGALARRYEEIGGRTVYAGKPHPPIYDLARRRLAGLGGPARVDRMLAIGDGIETDIAGAAAVGIDSVFVVGGIHAGAVVGPDGAIDPARLAGLFAGHPRPPVAVQQVLAW